MSDKFEKGKHFNSDTFRVTSTAGAVQVKNEKGEVSLQKVRVERYISGKRPGYAKKNQQSLGSEKNYSDDEDFLCQREIKTVQQKSQLYDPTEEQYSDDSLNEQQNSKSYITRNNAVELQEKHYTHDDKSNSSEVNDRRLKRLMKFKRESEKEGYVKKELQLFNRRRIHEPEILSDGDERVKFKPQREIDLENSDTCTEEDEDENEEEEAVQRRRDLMRKRAIARAQAGIEQEELMVKEDEMQVKTESSSAEDSSVEDSSDSEEEIRNKPVFVRKKDRLSTHEREREETRQRRLEEEEARKAELRRKESLRVVDTCVKEMLMDEKSKQNDPMVLLQVITDDENEEYEYDAWKLRELKRMRKDREERESRRKEEAETEWRRNMTEDERRQEARVAPKLVTNKSVKGNLKFLQKYYHKGSFFMDRENSLYKRDFSAPTLEDHFEKGVLPKAMQVKNFGRSSRTKYTHLLAEDTTEYDCPWTLDTPQNIKFQSVHAAAINSSFQKPSSRTSKE